MKTRKYGLTKWHAGAAALSLTMMLGVTFFGPGTKANRQAERHLDAVSALTNVQFQTDRLAHLQREFLNQPVDALRTAPRPFAQVFEDAISAYEMAYANFSEAKAALPKNTPSASAIEQNWALYKANVRSIFQSQYPNLSALTATSVLAIGREAHSQSLDNYSKALQKETLPLLQKKERLEPVRRVEQGVLAASTFVFLMIAILALISGLVPLFFGFIHPSKHYRILVVDDDLASNMISKRILNFFGHQVKCVDNGAAAVKALHENRYDLVLMDLKMPEMDGHVSAEIIRQDTDPLIRSVPIVALTGSKLKDDRLKCFQNGMSAVIEKPLSKEMIEQEFDRWVSSREAS